MVICTVGELLFNLTPSSLRARWVAGAGQLSSREHLRAVGNRVQHLSLGAAAAG